ncbi:hypothetical protein B0H13DRAFT_314367 [Mycena leptocephala]|nr:hypothetical protein B0H13DRAFT_314367 [Mycena leptocephala]
MKGRSPKMENDSKFQDYLARYNRWDVHKAETELYQPFVELANYCIGQRAKIQFCRDDPTIVHGSDAERKPDVVSIWEAALALGARTSVDNFSDGGPGKFDAFHWMELIAFWEFKFVPGGVDPVTLAFSSSSSMLESRAAERASELGQPWERGSVSTRAD